MQSRARADIVQFVLPKLPSPPHPARPNPTTASSATPSSSLAITLKPMKKEHPTIPLPSIPASSTSIYDLKTAYASHTGIPAAKIKILYNKKPATDSKTVVEVVGTDAGTEVEFGVMVLGGAVAAPAITSPVQSPPALAPSEQDKGLGDQTAAPAAQGPSGKEVVNDAFWSDLKGFVVQRIRDEAEGERMAAFFKAAYESHNAVP